MAEGLCDNHPREACAQCKRLLPLSRSPRTRPFPSADGEAARDVRPGGVRRAEPPAGEPAEERAGLPSPRRRRRGGRLRPDFPCGVGQGREARRRRTEGGRRLARHGEGRGYDGTRPRAHACLRRPAAGGRDRLRTGSPHVRRACRDWSPAQRRERHGLRRRGAEPLAVWRGDGWRQGTWPRHRHGPSRLLPHGRAPPHTPALHRVRPRPDAREAHGRIRVPPLWVQGRIPRRACEVRGPGEERVCHARPRAGDLDAVQAHQERGELAGLRLQVQGGERRDGLGRRARHHHVPLH